MRGNKQQKEEIDAKEARVYLKFAWIRKFNQVILGTTLCFFISLVIFTAISFSTLIFWPDILLSSLLWLFLGFAFAYSFTDDPIDRIKPGISLFGNLIFIVIIYIFAIFPWWSYAKILPIAYVLSIVLFICLCIGAILTATTNILVLNYRHKRKKENSKIFYVYRSGKVKKFLAICLLLTGIPLIILAIPGVLQIPITIEPQDYQAEIAFWGGYGNVSESIGETLNEHKATLVQCCFHDVTEEDGKQEFVKIITYYNNTYPDISIFFSITAFPGAFVWDGNTQNVVDYAKTIVSVIQEYNLTNVKGLAFDIEAPYFPYFGYMPDYDSTPNKERHEESIEIWYDFFDWMDENAPKLKLNAINYVESGIDVFDGDFDLHYIRRYSFLDLETDAFDEYAPMSYRGMYMGKKPYGGTMENPLVRYADGGHYWVYTQLNLQANALKEKFGDYDKMGVYLGITNCTCYNRDSVQYNRVPAGKGYDSLVRDALIAKHFGVKRITIFLLTTVVENGYSMGGVFDSYGDDFLDKFNESINGKDSTKPFLIWYKPRFNYFLSFGHLDSFVFDAYANLNSFLGIFYISLLFIVNGIVAYYGWKKIKTKVIENYRRID